MTTFRLTPLAEGDIAELLEYVARTSGEMRALSVYRDLWHAARILADQPRMGHRRDDLTPRSVLFWPVHSFLIVYRPDSCPVEIVRVVSGWRDVSRLLQEEDRSSGQGPGSSVAEGTPRYAVIGAPMLRAICGESAA